MKELSSEQRLPFLRASVDLRGLPDAALLAFAEATQLHSYPAKHIFYEVGESVRGRPLRLILHGRVRVQPALGEARAFGPGTLFGSDGFVDWVDQQDLGQRARKLAEAAHVLDNCSLLELAADGFAALVQAADGEPLRQRLLAVHETREHAAFVAAALAATPELTGVRADRLLELSEGATVVRLGVGDLLLAPGQPAPAIYVQLDGRVAVEPDFKLIHEFDPAAVRSGSVFGLRQLVREQLTPARVVVTADARFVAITAQRFRELLRVAPELRRVVQRRIAAQEGGG